MNDDSQETALEFPPRIEQTDDEYWSIYDRLEQWLQSPEADPRQLFDWLQGYDLPPVGSGGKDGSMEEPSDFLLRALAIDPTGTLKKILANRLVPILHRLLPPNARRIRFQVKKWPKRPNQVIRNLFVLSSGLGPHPALHETLSQISRDELVRASRDGMKQLLKGNWLGFSHDSALAGAIDVTKEDKA